MMMMSRPTRQVPRRVPRPLPTRPRCGDTAAARARRRGRERARLQVACTQPALRCHGARRARCPPTPTPAQRYWGYASLPSRLMITAGCRREIKCVRSARRRIQLGEDLFAVNGLPHTSEGLELLRERRRHAVEEAAPRCAACGRPVLPDEPQVVAHVMSCKCNVKRPCCPTSHRVCCRAWRETRRGGRASSSSRRLIQFTATMYAHGDVSSSSLDTAGRRMRRDVARRALRLRRHGRGARRRVPRARQAAILAALLLREVRQGVRRVRRDGERRTRIPPPPLRASEKRDLGVR